MKIVSNTGTDRVIDLIRPHFERGNQLDVVTPSFSLLAFAEMLEALSGLDKVQLLLPPEEADLAFLGGDADRAARNKLQTRWLALRCAEWVRDKMELRRTRGSVPQGAAVMRNAQAQPEQVILGSFAFGTDGLGITPGNPLSLIQASETVDEAIQLAQWFDAQWHSLKEQPEAKAALLAKLKAITDHRDPYSIYVLMLHHLFQSSGDEMDEERIVKSATGIRNTLVWKKLYKFQRDGVVGAIDKLNRFGGCIIADSVGLGKTFEALAIIKYHELRNDRVLVLCPKRLRDNWTLYKTNDKRNSLAADRLNYDVLNHTDLSRDGGSSGDIDLSHVNWGNYDLVVIDESHNFRNKATHKGKESRYDRLMRRIIQEGVKTRVLMLSATPVNNRLADLKNQIAFVTEGDDTALLDHGIASIDSTTRLAQKQFNRWLELDEAEKTPTCLIEMLGFDYFTLLDHLTIARSRRHIEKYYGTSETGHFPDRLPPINIKADVDRAGEFRSIRDINLEIRRLNLTSYAPLRYVLPHKQAAYDAKYSTQIRGGESFFRQVDREESLIHLLRVNVLKRMESAVSSFRLTVQRQLEDVEAMLARIESQTAEIEELDIADVDIEDPTFESLLVGRKVKVLLGDVDLIRWKQDLIEDRNRLATLLAAAMQVDPDRDAKLQALRNMIQNKCRNPINDGNRKIIVFTAFSDTAQYLYEQISGWAKKELGIETALVTGTGRNQTTIPGLRKDLASILTTFSPRSKERPEELAHEGTLDLLIATDCISEGQNLQDCDWLINYDIHWNPVRIIQRFGRIDRIGSPNQRIQLVNFWPNMELDEYINLEQRVSGRMVLLDISATGEENLIEQQSGNQMNDLEYRRKQLLKLQDTVIDLEDLSAGVSITDLTLTDFRIDLAQYYKAHPGKLEGIPLGACAVTTSEDADIPPGIVFCLRAEGAAADKIADSGYPLAPHYLVHVGEDGSVLLPYTQAKRILDRLKRLSLGRDLPDANPNVFQICTLRDIHTERERRQTIGRGLRLCVNQEGQRLRGFEINTLTVIATESYEQFADNLQKEIEADIGQTVFDMDKGDIKTLRLSKTGKAIVTGGVLLGVMQALALAAAGFDDDEPPEFLRERNLIIPIGGKKYISIPMPLGFHALPNVGRISTEYAMGGFRKPAEHVLRLVSVFAEAFNPIGSAGVSMQTIAPTALDPFAALAENKDWTGKPIYKADFNSMKPTPGFTRNKDTASYWSKLIAEGINYASGGTDYTPGAFSPTADQIDYLIGQVTGGVGREISKGFQTGSAYISGEDLPTHKMPLVGRFYGNLDDQSSQGNRYYTNLKEINLIEMELKGRREDHLPTDEFRKENPKAHLIARAKYADNIISKLRKQKRELIEKGAERERVRQVEERITAEMLRFNTAVDKFEASV